MALVTRSNFARSRSRAILAIALPIAVGALGTALPVSVRADGTALPDVAATPAASDLGNMKEEVLRIPFDANVGGPSLQTTLFEPTSGGRHPLVIMSHGTPRSADGLRMTRWRPVAQARWFVERGFAVAIPMRRGYAMSTGAFSESYGTCDAPNFVGAGRESAQDLKAALKGLSGRAEIDTSKTLLVGHSGGGFASLAFASEAPPEVVGVLNFAAGRGSVMAGAVCSPDRLAAAMQTFGATTKAPSLWLYSKNDTAFSPFIASIYFNAFGGEKHHAHFVELPAFKSDGHQIITDEAAMPLWEPAVQKFLDQLKLGTAANAQTK